MMEHFVFGRQTERAEEAAPEERESDTRLRDTAPERPQCHSPALSPTNPSANVDTKSIPGPTSIDSLAHKLSRQDLRLDGSAFVPPQPSPSSPPILPDIPHRQPCPTLETGHDPRLDNASLLGRRKLDSIILPLASSSHAMDTHRSLGSLVPGNTSRAFRRQQSTHFNTDPNNPTSSRTPQTVVEGMISSGSQCNVRSGPLPTPTSAMWLDPIIEPDDNLNFDPPCVDLEVDEAYCAGNLPDGDEMAWIESVMSLRRASTPGGIRKNRYLPYRPSADAGMRCANVVRNRPRMRRRKKLGPNSKASSAISSPISSPVIPPSLPDELGH